jgi:hypothetical protein
MQAAKWTIASQERICLSTASIKPGDPSSAFITCVACAFGIDDRDIAKVSYP